MTVWDADKFAQNTDKFSKNTGNFLYKKNLNKMNNDHVRPII